MSTRVLILFASLGILPFAGSPQSKEQKGVTAVKGNGQAATSVIGQPITGDEDLGDLSQPAQALARFYRAFNHRDLAMMEQSWDNSDDAVEVTPYGGIKRGWREIRPTYERLFSSPARVRVELYDYSVQTLGDLFYAVGWERGSYSGQGKEPQIRVRVTRIFRRERGDWREIHHHESFEDPGLLSAYQAALKGASR